jgi:hypothetical protein
MPKRRTRRRRGGELQTLDSPGPTQRELPVPALPKDDPQLIAQRQLPAPEKEKKWSNLWGLLGGSRRRRRTRRKRKSRVSRRKSRRRRKTRRKRKSRRRRRRR